MDFCAYLDNMKTLEIISKASDYSLEANMSAQDIFGCDGESVTVMS